MSKTIEIKVPDIGDFAGIPVIEVLVSAGDQVKEEQSLITLESDKATMEIPSPAAGVIREMKLKLDDTVSEGDLVAVLEVSDDVVTSGEEESQEGEKQSEEEQKGELEQALQKQDASDQPQSDQSKEEVKPEKSAHTPSGPSAVDPASVPYASPAIRRFARELGVDLTSVTGSGNKGRIIRNDVSAFVKNVMSGGAGAASRGGRRAWLRLPLITQSGLQSLWRF